MVYAEKHDKELSLLDLEHLQNKTKQNVHLIVCLMMKD